MPRKPGLWAVERGAIDPRYRHLWKDLKFCLPFLGMEAPTDVAGNHVITQVGTGLVYGAYMAPGVGYDRDGISMMFDDSAADNYLTTTYDPVLAGDFTVLVRVNAQAVITPDFDFIGAVAEKGANDPALIIKVETSGADRYQYFVRDVDGNSTGFTDFLGPFGDDLDVVTEGTADNLVVIRRGSVVHGYWHGVDTTVSGITGVVDLSGYPFYIAGRNSSGSVSNEDMEGSISLVAVWERALSVGEITQLDADPWGFLRPVPAAYKTSAAGGQTITGVLFTKAPTFATGQVNLRLLGVLHTQGPVFGTGSVASTLTGALFTKAPTFGIGEVQPQPVTLTGALFARAPTFATGAVQPQSVTVTGVLHTQVPTFPAGQANLRILGAAVFATAPTFGTGSVTLRILGALFAKAPTFPVGDVTTGETVTGVLFALAPTFATGAVQPQPVTLTGTLFTQSPAFGIGAVSLVGVFFWEPDPVFYTALEPAEVNPAP